MANSGNSDGLKSNILKIVEKVKSDDKRKMLLIVSSICILLFTIIFAFNANSGNTGQNKLAGTIKVQNVASEDTASVEEIRVINGVSDIKDTVNDIMDLDISTYAVNVEGKEVALFRTKNEAEELLDDIVKPYIDEEETKVQKIDFKEDVKILEKIAKVSELEENSDYEKILYYITKGTNETKVHKVEKGENYWVIAERYNISADSLIEANPGVEPEKLQIGQEISLVVPKPLITVVTTEIKDYAEDIAYETEYEETSVLYKGEYKIKQSGKKGKREVKAEISKENGIETNRNILEEKITSEPTTKVVLKGIKNPPPRIGTGKLARPTSRGVITSPFGIRWGRRHTGIDIGMPTGTTVKAADGGKVVYSGYKGGYGNCIIIDHGGNIETLYAHNSKLLVKKGDKVFKGQTIAKSGNTGNSTGPHLHFEVRKNGTPVNPIKYVKY